ncbi:DUF2442 domain-containing protein [Massilia sp. RP-1-19]|uniref:DUF2442 domain-containing protein n=1 Tax=Massilia polaris TaxID=2728846 RepID=A0A848HTR0_9BURK|nr:DUF2442 domain-containing protein [Massilia polaris]NML62693.1 DUF2442 domain-containing protein [Massilia polaris]
MSTSTPIPDERVKAVAFDDDSIHVELMDGRQVSAPLAWYPRLAAATAEQLAQWSVCGAGYGIHWSELDEDLSTEGLLRQQPAPMVRAAQRSDR